MRNFLVAALAAVLASGCASLNPGPTKKGLAVRVSSRTRPAARREALAGVLPLFFPDGVAENAARLDRLVLSRAGDFTGRERLGGRRPPVVEVLIDELAAVLMKEGLARPAGYVTGQERILIALGPSGRAPTKADLVVGSALRVALFGRNYVARDLHDPTDMANSDKDIERYKVLIETQTVAIAAGGWDWAVTGAVSAAVVRAPTRGVYRAAAHLDGNFYELAYSSAPIAFGGDSAVVDVSTSAAADHALEQLGAEVAGGVARRIAQRRAGRESVAFLLPGPKDPARVRALIAALRRVPEVEGASLYQWNGPFDSMDVWAFVQGLTPEGLVAKLLADDPDLRVVGIDSEAHEVFLEAPLPGPETD
jgi:hypothetical protein